MKLRHLSLLAIQMNLVSWNSLKKVIALTDPQSKTVYHPLPEDDPLQRNPNRFFQSEKSCCFKDYGFHELKKGVRCYSLI